MLGIVPRLRTTYQAPSLRPKPWSKAKVRFKGVKKLGQGSYGSAYAAKLQKRLVIVKVADPFPGGVKMDEALAALAKEVRVLTRLQKFPFVPRILEVGANYYVQEDVGGESMLNLLGKGGLEAREILAEVVAAGVILARFHQDGIAHNDFAPRNVLLTPGGVVVIDYGLAVERDRDGGPAFITAMRNDLVNLLEDALMAMEASDVPPGIRNQVLATVAQFRQRLQAGQFNETTAAEISRDLVFLLAQLTATGRRGKSKKRDRVHVNIADLVPGGRADNMSPRDFDPDQLRKGVKVEMEHTNNPRMALEIAMDHLTEHPRYYDLLEKMEATFHGVDNPPESVRLQTARKFLLEAKVQAARGYPDDARDYVAKATRLISAARLSPTNKWELIHARSLLRETLPDTMKSIKVLHDFNEGREPQEGNEDASF